MQGRAFRVEPAPAGGRALDVLLVEDHPLMAGAVSATITGMLAGEAQVLHCESMAEARRAFASRAYDLAILDLFLGGDSTEPLIAEFNAACPGGRAVVFSGHTTEAVVLSVLAGGAAGFIPKAARADLFRNALQIVLRGGVYVPPAGFHMGGEAAAVDAVGVAEFAARHRLTSKQVLVLELALTGKTSKSIAQALDLSPNTVRNHLTAIMQALGVHNRAEMVCKASAAGVTLPFRLA